MKAWFSRVPLYLTLVLVATSVGGCGESDNPNVAQSPAPSPEAFPSPSVPATLKNPSKVSLTRPTNPDDRLRVIKSGRNDPFGMLVPPKSTTTNTPVATNPRFVGQGYPSMPSSSERSPSRGERGSLGDKTLALARPGMSVRPGMSGGSSTPSVTLPKLPSATPSPEPAPEIKVTGVVDLMGQPQAIVQAPGEPTPRTVSVGDMLSGGLRVMSIVADRNAPYVIFQRGTQNFEVGVGRQPVLMASSRLPAFGSR